MVNGPRTTGYLPPSAASTSSVIRTSPSPRRSTGSSPTRSNPAGSSRASGSPPSASSARRCASTRTRFAPSTGGSPTTATSPAGTARGPSSPIATCTVAGPRRSAASSRRCSGAPAQAGFTPDEVAAAAYAAASERKRPGREVRVLFAECTTADAGYDAERLNREFAGLIEAEGTLLDEIPERLDRFHYDLVATTTMHADEAQAFARGRVPVVAMLVGPGLRRAGPRDRGAAGRQPGRRRLRLRPRRGEHRRDARRSRARRASS